MAYAAIMPQAALQSTFGETLEGPLAEIIVRNWGILITLVGGLLIYGAFRPNARSPALVVAGVSKTAFVGLVLSQGMYFVSHAGIAITLDVIWIGLFALYFLKTRGTPT
jgi:hypothetical protein